MIASGRATSPLFDEARIDLRPYQHDAVRNICAAIAAGLRRVLFVLPTGGGKTIVISFVTSTTSARDKWVCVLVHRQELVDQVSGSLAAMGVSHGRIAAGQPEAPDNVQVASWPRWCVDCTARSRLI